MVNTASRRRPASGGSPRPGQEQIEAPSPLLLALEARAPWEFGLGALAYPLLRQSPRGDGHSVLVLPGLAAGDLTTLPLRNFLKERGYEPVGWEMGLNFGPRPGVLDAMRSRVKQLHARSGRKVSLVGWSLGGIYARELAKMEPDKTRVVVTLGTPFAGNPKATHAWRLFELTSGTKIGDHTENFEIATPPKVPFTSIYSRSDGVVAWQNCIEKEGPLAENIEVQASHVGMGGNPLALFALADRLAQPEGGWKPFDRSGLRKYLYLDPLRASTFGFF
jgi:hypothetical protein